MNDFLENSTKFTEVEAFTKNRHKVLNDGLGSRWKFWRRKRYTVLLMIFLGEIVKAFLRSNLSIAVFPMTENITIVENGTEVHIQEFDWDAKTRGFLLSVFFYGYVATTIPGGILAVKYGGGKLFGLGLLLTSITTLLTPVAARIHLYLLIAVRIFEGICEGVLSPSMELLVSRWIPLEERNSCTAVTVTGSLWGHVIGIALSGAIGFHLGWRAIFYCSGGVGILWFIAWMYTVEEHPKLHKKITLSELKYIQKTTGKVHHVKSEVSSIPFVKIITSTPVWAIVISNISLSWANITFITQTPAYVKDVLKFNYESSGYLSSLSFFLSVLAAYITSPITDFVIVKNILSPTAARKIYICGCLTIMAMFGFLIQQATSVTSVFTCLVGMQVFTTVCVVPAVANILDVAPRYSSVLAGFGTSVFSICGMITPTVIGYLTQNKTPEEWQTVFSVQSGICLLGALLYGLLASGDLQPWAAESDGGMPEEENDSMRVKS